MIATLVLALSLAQPAAATATTSDKVAARALLREGTRLFDKGQHEAALERFTRAHALYPSPKLLYNIAQANRELGRKVEALAAFEGFLAQVEKPPARLAAEVRRSVAELQAQLAELQIRVDVTGAELQLDGKPLGLAPLPDSVWVTPGAHEIAARKHGFLPARKAIEARAGGVEQLAITLSPLTRVGGVGPGQSGPVAIAPIYKRPWFWVVVGGAVVAGTVAAVAWTAGGGRPVGQSP